MKRIVFIFLAFVGFVGIVSASEFSFDQSEYAKRRSKVMEKVQDGFAVIQGAQQTHSDYRFFQSNDFYYLTGIEIPDSILIIDGKKKESILFFTMTEYEAKGEGVPVELIRNPQEYTGIDRILPRENFDMFFSRLCSQHDTVYTLFVPEELAREAGNEKLNALRKKMILNPWDGRTTRELQFVKHIKEKFPYLTVKDCTKIIWNLRKIKSPHEIALIKHSAEIGVKAHRAMIQSTRTGLKEFELAALFDYFCRKEGATEQAFATIIMSGPNHYYGHYHIYDRTLEDGDFIILDAGPDYQYYNADISTTFPANGKFNQRQREIYQLGYELRDICLQTYRPGITLRDVGRKLEEHLVQKGKDPKNFRGLTTWGGYNHPIGLATHDVMGTLDGPDEVLQPGFVFACDINMPYADEELGIRLEDTVVITEEGCENLSDGLPRTIGEIEAMMKQDGVIQTLQKAGHY